MSNDEHSAMPVIPDTARFVLEWLSAGLVFVPICFGLSLLSKPLMYWLCCLIPAMVGLLTCVPEVVTRFYEARLPKEKWPGFVRSQARDSKRGFECWIGLVMLVPGVGLVVCLMLLRGVVFFVIFELINFIRRKRQLPEFID